MVFPLLAIGRWARKTQRCWWRCGSHVDAMTMSCWAFFYSRKGMRSSIPERFAFFFLNKLWSVFVVEFRRSFTASYFSTKMGFTLHPLILHWRVSSIKAKDDIVTGIAKEFLCVGWDSTARYTLKNRPQCNRIIRSIVLRLAQLQRFSCRFCHIFWTRIAMPWPP